MSRKVMIGCRVASNVKSELEMTATSLGVTESAIVHDAVLQYLGLPEEKTPMSRIEAIELAIDNLRSEYDRIVRMLSASDL